MNENRTARTSARLVGESAIPSISVENSEPVVERKHTEIVQDVPQQQRVSLSQLIPQSQHSSGNTVAVDIDNILPETKKGKNESEPGVTILESPQAEILKPGGIFDTYVQEKKKEMIERINKEQEEGRWDEQGNLVEQEDTTEEAKEDDGKDHDEEEILKETGEPSNEVEEYEVKEVYSEEDSDNEESGSNNDAAPFYTTVGYKDDFHYLDDYSNLDLPTDDDETLSPVETTEGNNAVVKTEVEVPEVEFVLNDDEDDLDSDVDEDEDSDKRLEELKAEITAKLKPKAASLNLSGFTVANKATVSNKILEIKTASAGKWVLPNTGICIQVREISGQKLEYMRGNETQSTMEMRNRLKTIYDHIISPKPSTFEAWTKSIAYDDYDHLFMPVYLAAFDGVNYMPVTCVIEKGKIAKKNTGCGKMFITDSIDIMKSVKFKDDDAKKRFWNLYRSDRFNSEGLYVSEIIPISDSFAIAFKMPSIYDVFLEPASYGREFMEKHDRIIGVMPYIDNIYWIDHANSKLVPIAYKKYDNNAAKTAKSKVLRYSKIFDTFRTDEYSNIQSLIASINKSNDDITYIVPEFTCPECGRTIKSEETSAQALLFTRHRLGVLANSSIN